MSNNPPSLRYPWELDLEGVPPIMHHHFTSLWNSITDLQQAIPALKSQITQLQTATKNSTATSAKSVADPPLLFDPEIGLTPTQIEGRSGTSPVGGFSANSSATAATNASYAKGAYIAGVSNQGSGTSYTLQSTDYNGIIVFNTASPVSVTLNPNVATNFAASVMNIGSGQMTVTPSSGTVNGGATATFSGFGTVAYDGKNWFALSFNGVLPATFAPIAHEFLTGYSASTGTFSAAQPAFSDISGNLTTAQLPVSGLTATITTAKLTPGGSNGSQTFTNGILTAQTPAT